MNNIRVTYSGLLSFTVGISSIITGLGFSLIVTRSLSTQEFGTWSLITALLGYLVLSETIVNYWSTRDLARGLEVGKTSFVSGSMLAFGSIPIYIAIAIILSQNSNAISYSLLLGSILVPLYLLSKNLTAINISFQPHKTSHSLMLGEIIRVPSALIFVYFLELGVDGAIFAIFVSYLIKVIYQIFLARTKLKNKFNIKHLKKWLKLSWLSLYSAFPAFLKTFDITLYTIISSSVIGLAFYSASFIIGQLVTHSERISQGLYPKLLSGGDYTYISKNLLLSLYFGLPLVGLTIVFSKPALYALNPIYQDAFLVVIFISIQSFFLSQTNIIQKSLLGIEKIDTMGTPSFRSVINTNLFKLPTFRYIKYGIYLIILTIVFIFGKNNSSELELIILWALISALIEIPYFGFLWLFFKKKTNLPFYSKDALKYLGATILIMLIYWQTSDYIINYHESIFYFLPTLILEFIICISAYIGITYIIDKKTRRLYQSLVSEVFNKKND